MGSSGNQLVLMIVWSCIISDCMFWVFRLGRWFKSLDLNHTAVTPSQLLQKNRGVFPKILLEQTNGLNQLS